MMLLSILNKNLLFIIDKKIVNKNEKKNIQNKKITK